jgi:hypothetical protein
MMRQKSTKIAVSEAAEFSAVLGFVSSGNHAVNSNRGG